MTAVHDKKGEQDFNEWLESIQFVDSEGKPLPSELTEDDSQDPENDRAEEDEND